MKKSDLTAAVEAYKANTQAALQTVYNALDQDQQKQVVQDESVKTLLDIHNVEHTE